MRTGIFFATIVALAMGSGVVAQPTFPSDPQPASNPGEWVLASDWPRDLLVGHVEGSVRAELNIDATGAVIDCQVIQSSGYDAMDNVACARLKDRAKFIPARDEAGEETAGIYRTTVQFRFNDTLPEIPRDMNTRMSFIVEPDGTVSNCTFARSSEGETEASNRCPAGRRYEPPLNEAGEPVRIQLEVESTVKRTELPD